jgi:histidine triad (HIT) family protein
MPTVFTRIIDGELPGRFVWRDDACVAFLSINPLAVGHALVVPRTEVDHWLDLPPEVAARCFEVARVVGVAQQRAFRPRRVGLAIAGFEVPHTHLHVIPIDDMSDLDFRNADASPDPAELDAARERLARQLATDGHEAATP